jgi:hypothetical protein
MRPSRFDTDGKLHLNYESGTTGMSSGGSNPDYTSVYIFLGVLLLVVIRRLRLVFKGAKVSRLRTVIFSAYYVVLALLFTSTSFFYGGATAEDAVLYIVVGAAGAYGSYLFSDKRIGFWKGADGSIYYRGSVIIYLIYLVGLVARIAIDLALIGPQAFTFTASPGTTPLSATAIDAGIITDLLLTLGAGLLVGRNARVMKRYSAILQGKETVADTPPKISLT